MVTFIQRIVDSLSLLGYDVIVCDRLLDQDLNTLKYPVAIVMHSGISMLASDTISYSFSVTLLQNDEPFKTFQYTSNSALGLLRDLKKKYGNPISNSIYQVSWKEPRVSGCTLSASFKLAGTSHCGPLNIISPQ